MPIIVSGGVAGVTLHRPPGVAVIADIRPGSIRLKLDAFELNATTTNLHWESAGASGFRDRYELRTNGGAVQVTMDENAKAESVPGEGPESNLIGEPGSALDILLDGVEKRVSAS